MVIKNKVILTTSLKFIQNELINVDYYFFEKKIKNSKILAKLGFIFIFPIYLKKPIFIFIFKYIHASNEAIYGLESLKSSYSNMKNVPDFL